MALRTELNQVANGRRLAARKIVMTTLASIPCQVWRKVIESADIVDPNPEASDLTWDAVRLSDNDEPEYRYDVQGYAYLLLDKFTGANVLENYSMVDGADTVILAQVEPYDFDLDDELEQIQQIPDWQPKQGDLFALLLDPKLILWLELVDITGQTFMADFGKKYIFNKRDDLTHIEPFTTEYQNREV